MSTNKLSIKNIKRDWHLIDAKDKVLGRVATEIARILMGKNKAAYVPYLDSGDFVVVTNASKVKLSGKKSETKKYVRHSGYPGGLKEESFESMLRRKPEYIIEHAVEGMIPRTKLGRQMIKKLKVFATQEHPYQKQVGE